MTTQPSCKASGQLVQLHLEDEITKKRRCLDCGAPLEVIPRKPREGEGLTSGFTSVAILPVHREHP